MTKIYVVTATLTDGVLNDQFISGVYTNKKLALSEAKYFNLKGTRQGSKRVFQVEEHYISKLDWSEDYKKLLEELPY